MFAIRTPFIVLIELFVTWKTFGLLGQWLVKPHWTVLTSCLCGVIIVFTGLAIYTSPLVKPVVFRMIKGRSDRTHCAILYETSFLRGCGYVNSGIYIPTGRTMYALTLYELICFLEKRRIFIVFQRKRYIYTCAIPPSFVTINSICYLLIRPHRYLGEVCIMGTVSIIIR